LERRSSLTAWASSFFSGAGLSFFVAWRFARSFLGVAYSVKAGRGAALLWRGRRSYFLRRDFGFLEEWGFSGGRPRCAGHAARWEARRLSWATDLGSMSHWPLPGRPGCFCFVPARRPRARRRQTSALVVFITTAACCAVSQWCRLGGMGESFGSSGDNRVTVASVIECSNRGNTGGVDFTERGMRMQVDTGKPVLGRQRLAGEVGSLRTRLVGVAPRGAEATTYNHAPRCPFSDGHRYFLNRSSKACRASL